MKTRIISGAVGIIIFAAAIVASLTIDTVIMHVLLAVVGCIGVYEALKTTGYVKSKFLLVSSIVYAAITPFVYSFDMLGPKFIGVDMPIKHEICLILYAVVIFTISMFRHNEIKPLEVTYAFAATVAITYAFWSLAAVFSNPDGNGLFYLIIVVIAAWGCDTGAYFSGYFFGKHKMAPEISPKKTVEGAIGGVITDVLLMFVACLIFHEITGKTANLITILCATPFLALAGMMGDLIFSYIKRDCGIKDYGKLMPGHGGVLDRFDSVAVVAPLVYLVVEHLPMV
ncbi:MAG: phosphatidate cytidylyltransferase [Clostridia bacterium]|nr:phosphatidate cytidylyltransferase [Clostridia bacterium]